MFILVRANNLGSATGGAWRAGRFFLNGQDVRLEVVAGTDPLGPADADGKPSMEKITEAGRDLLHADGRISVMGDSEAQDRAANAVIDSLRTQLARAQADLSDARVKIAELEGKGKAKEPAHEAKPAAKAEAHGKGGKAKE